MTAIEIWALVVMLGATVILFSVLWKFRNMNKQRKALDAKFAKYDTKLKERKDEEGRRELARMQLRMHPNYGNPQFDPLNPDVLKPRESVATQKRRYQTQTVGNNSVGVQSGSSTTVVHDSSSDLLTNVLLYSMMNNQANKVSVRYDDDTGRVETKSYDEPKQESSYSSTYSSSSDDDSSSRSSYSSSYSSSSSDSSYSSSSSDSSYSSD